MPCPCARAAGKLPSPSLGESGIAPAAFRPQARPPSPRIARTKTHAHQNPTRTDKADAQLASHLTARISLTRIASH